MSHQQKPSYTLIWVILMVAFFVSLGIGSVSNSLTAIAAIFIIAGMKALLVLTQFMHLGLEPRWIRSIMAVALAVIGILYVGLLPDIQLVQTGFGRMASPSGAVAAVEPHSGEVLSGKAVFETRCVACHQSDGRGMQGLLAADFVGDKARLAKSDAELLTSIREGLNGSVGVMPPWDGVLTEQEQKAVLQYIREAFGSP